MHEKQFIRMETLDYFQLTVFLGVSLTLSGFLLLLSYSLSKKKKNETEKVSAYECGFDPFGSGVGAFDVQFYVVGVLFIIFDLEIVFLYPWAIHSGVLGGSGFCAMLSFLSILTVGFVYEWQKGALDWSRSGVSPLQEVTVAATPLPAESAQLQGIEDLEVFLIPAWVKTDRVLREIKASVFWFVFGLAIQGWGVSFGEFEFLFVILGCLIFAATKRAFGFRWTGNQRHKIISTQLFGAMGVVTFVGLSFKSADALTLFFHQSYTISNFYTESIKHYLIFCTMFFFLITTEYLVKYSAAKQINLIEFPVVLCFALFFMLLLVSSFNIFGAYVGLEGLTFSLYILAGMNYNSQNALEAGMKYFCLGALSSGILLFGIALTFIIAKTLDFAELRFLFNTVKALPLLLSYSLIFIFFGFWFKLSIFPCHAWTPDVYEGVLTPVTLFLATAVKFGVFAFFVRILFFLLGAKIFLSFWQPVFLVVSAGSIVVGGFGALLQTKLKRFIGYTSINQMGYLLVGVSSGDLAGLQASFLYLFFYIITGFAFFAVLLYVTDFDTGQDILFIQELSLFGSQHRNLSLFLALILFSMAGLPPMAGFFSKFFLFFSAFQAGNHSLVFLGFLMNAISAFYYLRIVKCMFFEDPQIHEQKPISYFFFSSTDPTSSIGHDLVLLAFCVILLAAPFFLNHLLLVVGELAFAASYINTGIIFQI
jgi:NADH-quinone oxidoreductase subunit N